MLCSLPSEGRNEASTTVVVDVVGVFVGVFAARVDVV